MLVLEHMVNQQLVIYIEQAKAKGLPDKEILAALKVDPAWVSLTDAEAIDAFAFVNGNNRPVVPTVGPAPVLSTANFALPHKALIACVVVTALILVGGGVVLAKKKGFVTQLLHADPQAAWGAFIQNQNIEPYAQEVTIEYADSGSGGANGPLSMKVTDSGFTNGQSSLENTELQHTVSYSVNAGGQQIGGGLEFRLLGKSLYVNLKDTPLGTFLRESDQNKTQTSWLKLSLDPKDLGDVTAQVLPGGADESSADTTVLQQKAREVKLKQVFEKPEILGSEQVRGQNTVHLKLGFNKQALQDSVEQVLSVIAVGQSAEKRELLQKLTTAWLDKFQVKDFQAWVGEKDGRLYKVVFKSNAPSYASLTETVSGVALGNARQRAADAKRLADIRQLASALELYFNDHGVYPKAGQNGAPANMAPNYIGAVPEAPPASGLCTDYYNAYWYTPVGPLQSGADGEQGYADYIYTFCLGSSNGGYSEGVNKLTPKGISSAECVSTEAHPCSSGMSKNDPEDLAQEFIKQLDFNASFTLTGEYFDYGKPRTVEAPAQSVDIMEELQKAKGLSRDAKRLADVRQLASAAELYFNDNEHYPIDLEELVPTYIGVLPVVPTPQDGACTAEQNKYSYKGSGKTYALSFCLGNTTGGYAPGPHVLSEQGIR